MIKVVANLAPLLEDCCTWDARKAVCDDSHQFATGVHINSADSEGHFSPVTTRTPYSRAASSSQVQTYSAKLRRTMIS